MFPTMERIEKIKYTESPAGTDLFLSGPAEFLISQLVLQLAAVPQFKAVFGDSIFGYQRMDFSIRQLPGMRIYNETYTKDAENWYVNGDIKMDIVWPANLRREELQQLPDSITAALMQQLRRPTFFNSMQAVVPGLNELGKVFSVDKTLGFDWGEEIVPLTQVTVNFRIDLREWDLYLEQTDRTKDIPFEKTLGDLKKLNMLFEGLQDDMEKALEIPSSQQV